MESQQVEDFNRDTAPVLICQQCGGTFFLLPNSQIAVNESFSSFGIIVSKEEALCLRCLQERVRLQMRQARLHQQRFIFHKEFESSYQQPQQAYKGLRGIEEQEIKKLNEEIAKLIKDQEDITQNLAKIKDETNQLKDKIFAFQVEEEKFWQGINKIERRTNKVQEKSLYTKFDKNQGKELLDQLSKMSVLHLFTDIAIDDNVALVQGMAMGKRSEGVDVSWEEVAVGLGHLLLAMNILGLKYTYDYRLIESIKLKGIQSEITLKKQKKRLYVWNSKENEKQIGELLQTLLIQTYYLSQQILNAENISYTEQFRTPFLININQSKIAEMFIDPFKMDQRIRWNNWTKAMRYFLINFKHMITVYAINDKYL